MRLCTLKWFLAASHIFFIIALALCSSQALGARVKQTPHPNEPLTYIWPLPAQFSFGDDTLSVDPGLSLTVDGNGSGSDIVRAAFDRYRGIIFNRIDRFSSLRKLRDRITVYMLAHCVLLFILPARSFNLVLMKAILCSFQSPTDSPLLGKYRLRYTDPPTPDPPNGSGFSPFPIPSAAMRCFPTSNLILPRIPEEKEQEK